ncbi:hypothetical protein [Paenibacillus chitinolyticus]|uniref:hypothetical protein n=1 Tax=Paenibacillus chitinolyticus TaxID=79263 RepID=UPI00366C19E3
MVNGKNEKAISEALDFFEKVFNKEPEQKEIVVQTVLAYVESTDGLRLKNLINEIFDTNIGVKFELCLLAKEITLELLKKNTYENSTFFKYLISVFSNRVVHRFIFLDDPYSLSNIAHLNSFVRLTRADGTKFDFSLVSKDLKYLIESNLEIYFDEYVSDDGESNSEALEFFGNLLSKCTEAINEINKSKDVKSSGEPDE